MGVYSIACYRPLPGKDDELFQEVKNHLPVLRGENLITDSPSVVMKAADGTFVEIFEWVSQEAIHQAHSNPQVLAMWERFGACCEYVPMDTLAESHDMFGNYAPVVF